MKIGIIDNDLCTRKSYSYPNLALMKLSNYHKIKGDFVELIDIDTPIGLFASDFDIYYCGKVFTDTYTPNHIIKNDKVIKGGSGFYFDKAEKLPYDIEHSKPDYELYNKHVINKFVPKNRTVNFSDFSIGFTTRGCIRSCDFCINRSNKKVELHSPVEEFLDKNRKYIMLWDDNIMASKHVYDIFETLNKTGKPFVYKQGLDIRLINEEKAEMLLKSNYYRPKDIRNKVAHFAFDNISDYDKIISKIELLNNKRDSSWVFTLYVFTGFDRNNNYDFDFFEQDFKDLIIRIKILFELGCQPYVMLHENYKLSHLKKWIELVKNYCNSPLNYGHTLYEHLINLGKKHNEIFFNSDFKIKVRTYT